MAFDPDQIAPPNALTCIHGRIHCAATHDEEPLSETDRLQLNHFFEILAEVALSVAKRRLALRGVTEPCEQ